MLTYFPKYFTNKPLLVYLSLLLLSVFLFSDNVLPIHWIIFGIIELIGFFYYANILTKKWESLSISIFEKKLFEAAFSIRLIYVFVSYLFYEYMTGQPFEFDTADAYGYHNEAVWMLQLIEADKFHEYVEYIKGKYSDLGYVAYLATIYSVSDNSILLIRILKALMSAYTCLVVFKITVRNFGESTGKIAGIITMLYPNLIYYCGLHLKETEMIFLTVLFIDRADQVIKKKNFSPLFLALTIVLGLSLFFFRTVLGAVAFMSFLVAFILSENRVLSMEKKVVLGGLILALGFVLRGGAIADEVKDTWEKKDINQSKSMEARSQRGDGNKLAKYGTAVFFAPVIIMAPFPTIVNVETQQNQMLMNGAFLVKNICAFFVIIALLSIYKQKQWRSYILLLTFYFGYLLVLVLSKFALSERFHMPVLLFFIIFASHGITQITNNNKKHYLLFLFLVFILVWGWNTFKIVGRGEF